MPPAEDGGMEISMSKGPYDANFFNSRTEVIHSAEVVVPLLFSYFRPKSVVDLGCATGDWLQVFQQFGCEIKGFDGEYVLDDNVQMKIDKAYFEPKDLNQPLFPGGKPEKKYDLAMTLEVAEHLDPERAQGFVEDITSLSDVILFSAAIPLQVGTHHVNCQWQSYWAEKFARRGYMLFDCFRPVIWNDERVNVIYRNNMFLYINRNSSNENVQELMNRMPAISLASIDMIHRDLYLSIASSLIGQINQLNGTVGELQRNYEPLKNRLLKLQEKILE